MRYLALCVVLTGSTRAEECPLPEIRLASVAADDRSFDLARSRELVAALIIAARADAGRDPLAVGAELDQLTEGAGKPVGYEVRSLAVRLRQLDCAVWSGRPAGRLYEAFVDDAQLLLVRLGGAPLPASPAAPPVGVVLPPPRVPAAVKDFKRRARGYRIGGGLSLAGGMLYLAEALAVTVAAARPPPPPCGGGYFCLSGLYDSAHPALVAGAVVSWIVGAAAVVTGGVLLNRGASWAEKAKLGPTVAVGSNGASAGVRFEF